MGIDKRISSIEAGAHIEPRSLWDYVIFVDSGTLWHSQYEYSPKGNRHHMLKPRTLEAGPLERCNAPARCHVKLFPGKRAKSICGRCEPSRTTNPAYI